MLLSASAIASGCNQGHESMICTMTAPRRSADCSSAPVRATTGSCATRASAGRSASLPILRCRFDVPTGGDGNDTLVSSVANDILQRGGGQDTLSGQGGSDALTGDAGNDTLTPGGGDDNVVDGGADTDTVSYDDGRGGVTVTLNDGTAGNDGSADDGNAGNREAVIGTESLIGSARRTPSPGDGAFNTIRGRGATTSSRWAHAGLARRRETGRTGRLWRPCRSRHGRGWTPRASNKNGSSGENDRTIGFEAVRGGAGADDKRLPGR